MGISVTPLPVAFGAWNCSHDGPRCQKIWIWLIRSDNGGGQLGVARVPHRYGNTRGVSKTGNTGTVTVLIFGAP